MLLTAICDEGNIHRAAEVLNMSQPAASKLLKDLDTGLEGRHVIIVEDIVDTGLTLTYPFTQKAALAAFQLYVKELELADPISASGQANQTKLLLAGKSVDDALIKDEMGKLVNGQQDAQKTVDNIVSGLNQQIG